MQNEFKKEAAFASELWTFYKKFARAENTDPYWKDVVDAADQIEKKYGEEQTMHRILLDVIECLEARAMSTAPVE